MDHAWQQPRLPAGFAGSRKVTGTLAGTQHSGNITSVMLGACLALARRPVAGITAGYAGRLEMFVLLSAVTQHKAPP